MISLALNILAAIVNLFVIGAGLGLLWMLLKFVLGIPIALYVGANRYRLSQNGTDKEFDDLPKMSQILRFYFRVVTFRRPLLP
ncbi:hypothetical protein JCM15765_02650 [Paradesulfitobacterium aromaticivorans]